MVPRVSLQFLFIGSLEQGPHTDNVVGEREGEAEGF